MQVSVTGLYTCLSHYEVHIGSLLYTLTIFKFLKDSSSQRIKKIIMKENKEQVIKIIE